MKTISPGFKVGWGVAAAAAGLIVFVVTIAAAEPPVTPPREHPRVLVRAEDLPVVRAARADPALEPHWQEVMRRSGLPEAYRPGALYDVAIIQAAEANAFRYLLDGDTAAGRRLAGLARRTSALATAGIALPGTLASCMSLARARVRRPAPSERINLAIVGFGTIAHRTVINFLGDSRVQVVAVADPVSDLPNTGSQQRSSVHFRTACEFVRNGILFEGQNGKSIFVARGRLEMNPEELRKEVIRDEEIRLYESKLHEWNFVDQIYGDRPTISPVEVGHRSITIAHLANIAIRLGRTSLRWDPAAERFPDDSAANNMLSRPMRQAYAV